MENDDLIQKLRALIEKWRKEAKELDDLAVFEPHVVCEADAYRDCADELESVLKEVNP